MAKKKAAPVVYTPYVDTSKLTREETGIQKQENILIEQKTYAGSALPGGTTVIINDVPQGKVFLINNIILSVGVRSQRIGGAGTNIESVIVELVNSAGIGKNIVWLQDYQGWNNSDVNTGGYLENIQFDKPLLMNYNDQLKLFNLVTGNIYINLFVSGILVDKSVDLKQFFV